jgi:DUF4097 and DUF4098 domain-containing protein YvlB
MRGAVLAALITLVAVGFYAVDAGAEEVVFDDSFAVKAGGKLRATVGDMDIVLKVGKSDQARVEVVVTGNIDKMRERFEKMEFSAELQGNTLVLDTEDRRSWTSGWWGSSSRGNIRLTVTMPQQFDVYAQTSDGDIAAGGQEGEIELKSSDGDITVDRLTGPMIHLSTSDGDIDVDDIRGDDISLRSSDGDLTADLLKGTSVTLKTSDGNVDADKIDGETIAVRSSDGDLDLTVSGGELRAKTSDGDIAVTVVGQMALDLSTSDGDITIQVPRDFGAELELKGERVKLGGKIALEGEVSERRVRGTLGDGGPRVIARTSDGSVALRFD